jgi:hypothetical protein
MFGPGWAQYQNHGKDPMRSDTVLALIEMWEQGQKDKSGKVSAEKAISRLIDGVMARNWLERLNVSVPRIKQFFGKDKVQMEKLKEICLGGGTIGHPMKNLLNSYVGRRVAFKEQHENTCVIRKGTVKAKNKFIREGEGRSGQIVGALYNVKIDDQHRLMKDLNHKDIEQAMKYFDELEGVGGGDDANDDEELGRIDVVMAEIGELMEEAVRTDSTRILEVPFSEGVEL